MTGYLWNLAAYSIQLGALAGVAFAAIRLLRLRVPRMSLRFWQAVMGIALLLPFAQPPRADDLLGSIVRSDALASATEVAAEWAPRGADVATIVMAMLAAGVVLRLMWLGIGLLRLRSLVGNATADASLEPTAGDLARALDVAASIKVSVDLKGPATVGFRRPVILVPRSVLQLPAAVQRAILCHELLHVKRRDWLHTIAEEIWCAVLWFHPGARLIASHLSLAREMVVDEQTILTTRDRRAYAEALLAFSDPQPYLIGATPFIGRHTLSQRISLIASEVSMSRRRALSSVAVALTVCLGVTVVAVDRFPMFTTLQAQSTVYEIPGPGITLPVAVKEVKPAYTAAAMEKKIQGSVWLKAVVGANGDISDVQVTRSLDEEFGLDQEAVKACWQWKFKPAVKDGQPVAVRVTIELTFTLKK